MSNIPDLATLESVRAYINDRKHTGEVEYFKLTNDIDMSGSSWTPIGNSDIQFKGTFDGDGHTISGLNINSGSDYQGLFGYVGAGGTIKNLTVKGSVTGGNYVGGITGQNDGSIEFCRSDVAVSGSSYVGGIAGGNTDTISDCGNSGSVNGSIAGGIAGSNNGSINNSYNVGDNTSIGGITGQNGGKVENCYYINGTSNDGSSVQKTADDFHSGVVTWYLQNNRNPQSDELLWGQRIGEDDLPIRTNNSPKEVHKVSFTLDDVEYNVQYFNKNYIVTLPENPTKQGYIFSHWNSNGEKFDPTIAINQNITVNAIMLYDFDGEGTENNPNLIPDLATLEQFYTYVAEAESTKEEYFKLTADIDMSTKYGSDTMSWQPIGNNKKPFEGIFDGNDKTIEGLYINSASTYQGLFGYIDHGAIIKNLSVSGFVYGSSNIGGIAGYAYSSTIDNCNYSGIVNGSGHICGIAGTTSRGSIKNCYNSADIDGYTYVGGIAAETSYTNVENFVNTGSVTESGLYCRYAGGLIGEIVGGTINNCYNLGDVSCEEDYVAGLIVYVNTGTITNCYNAGSITATEQSYYIGGLVGYSYAGKVTNSYYIDTVSSDSSGARSGTSKSIDEFKSGSVAWLLQNGKASQVWGQKLSDDADTYPVLTTDGSKKVCKVTFATNDNENYDVKYTNSNKTVTLPEPPTKDGYIFEKWSQTSRTDGDKFTNMTPVTSDMTVYGIGRELFGGESDTISLNAVYGEGKTLDLSEYVAYKNESDTKGKFTYTIESDESSTNSDIDGDMLTIPKDLNVGEYTLTIKAAENEPEYALVSVEDFGTEDVTLTVKVSIAKVASSVTVEPTANDLTYTGTAQELVTAGTADGGEMQYSTDNESYSSDIPTETNVGTYTVWYKVKGDSNHEDTEPVQIENIKIEKAEPSAMVTAKDLTYTGSEQELVSGETADGTLKYATEETGDYTESIPKGTNAEKYTVWYKVVGDSNHNDSAPQSVEVTIKKAASTATVTPKDLTYTGAAQELVTGETADGTLKYATDEAGEYTDAVPTGTEAKDYEVWYKVVGDGNHNDSTPQKVDVTIKKANSTLAVDGGEVTYGDTITLTATVTRDNTSGIRLAAVDAVEFYLGETPLGSGTVTYDSLFNDSGTATLTITADKKFEIGANTIRAEYGGSVNLNGSDNNSITVTMKQKPLTYDVTADGKVYDENTSVNVTLTPTNNGEDDVTLTAKGAVSSANVGSYSKVDLTEIALDGDDAKYYSVETEKSGADLTAEIEITKAPSSVKTSPTAKDLTYTGEPLELVTAGEADGGEMQYSLDGETYSSDVPKGINADVYTVWYKVKGDSNHNDSTPQSVDVTIEKADSTLTVDGGDVTYGDTITLTATVARDNTNGIRLAAVDAVEFYLDETPLGSGTVTYDSLFNDSGTATLTITADKKFEIGANTIRAEYGGSVNLNGSENNSITVTMKQKPLTYDVTADGKVYDENTSVDVTLTPTNNGEDDVTLTAKGAVSSANVDSYGKVDLTEIKADGEDAKYYSVETEKSGADLTAEIEITKAPSSVKTSPAAKDLTYTGEPLELVTAGEADGGEMQYSLDGETYSPDVPEGTNADTYTVWYKVVGDSNHEDTEPQSVEVTIKKAAATANVTANDLTYTGEAQELVTGETADGELQYSLNNADYSASIPKGTNADTYTVWYKVVGDSNHEDTEPQSVDVTIKKADSDVTVADNGVTYGGELTLTAEVKKSDADGISLMSAAQDQVEFKAGEASLGTANVTYSDGELKSVGTATLTVKIDKAKYDAIKAADGKITAEYGGSVNLNESTKNNITVTLNKKTLTYTAAAISRAYNGETTVEVSLTPTNADEDNVTLTATGTIENANAGNGKSVTITDVTIGGEDAEYYQAADAPTGDVTVDITKADSEITEAPTAKDNLTYTGEALELLDNKGTATGGELQYKVDDGTYSTDEPKATTAGGHTVYYKVIENENYNGIEEQSITVTIAKATPTFPTVAAINATYAEGMMLESVDLPTVADGALSWADEAIPVTEGTHEYDALFTPTDEANYKTAAGKITVTATAEAVPTDTPIPSAAATAAPSDTPAPTATATAEPTDVPTATAVPTNTPTPIATATAVPTDIPTPTATATAAATYTPAPTATATAEPTDTPMSSATATAEPTVTPTVTAAPATTPVPKYDISGNVKKSDGTAAANHKITLKPLGSEAITDENGNYAFNGVEVGSYNIVVEMSDGKTVTKLVEVTDSDVSADIMLPAANVGSVVETIDSDNSTDIKVEDIVVGGLDTLAETVSEELSEADKTKDIEVKITVESKPESAGDAAQQAIKQQSGNKTEKLDYIDIDIVKTVGTVSENITETSNLITIVIPFVTDGKKDITVYRYHDGAAAAMTKGSTGEHYEVGDGVVTIYSRKFSTYAIAYNEESTQPNISPTPNTGYTGGGTYSGGSSSYTVQFETNGGSKVTSQRISRNGVVKEPTAPTKDGYMFAGWYTDKNLTTEYDFTSKVTKSFTLYAKWNEKKTETTPAPADAPQSTAKSMPFTDVNTGDWFYNDVRYVYENGLMNGVSDNEFAPNENITRGMFVTILYRMEGEPNAGTGAFADIPSGAYYANAVAWANANGIVKGYSDIEYAPDDAVTREQAATILFRYAAYKGESPTGAWAIQLGYTDLSDISDWAVEGVMFCKLKGIMAGRDTGEFDPQSDITRAEGAAVFERYLNMAK